MTELVDYPPTKVEVTNAEKIGITRRRFIDVISKTYLASATAPEGILGRSEGRLRATIAVLGTLPTNSQVVLCDNEADAGNALRWTQTGTLAGAVLQPGQVVDIRHHDEVWLAAVGAGTPPLVSVIAEFVR
jgi:hypothetical protein